MGRHKKKYCWKKVKPRGIDIRRRNMKRYPPILLGIIERRKNERVR